MTLYKQTQYGTFITTIISVIAISTGTLFVLQTGNTPITWALLTSILLLFLLIILTFYKLTITIDNDNDKIEAKFGVGLLKRSLKIKDINYDSIENIKVPMLYGIGIRLTPHGWLYNVKTGNAIKIKSNNSTFFVGTEDFKTIHSILLKMKKQLFYYT